MATKIEALRARILTMARKVSAMDTQTIGNITNPEASPERRKDAIIAFAVDRQLAEAELRTVLVSLTASDVVSLLHKAGEPDGTDNY